jgi:hypothetical protein
VNQLPDELSRVLAVLWNCLSNMKDDLSSSVGAVMELLGKLLFVINRTMPANDLYREARSIRQSNRYNS